MSDEVNDVPQHRLRLPVKDRKLWTFAQALRWIQCHDPEPHELRDDLPGLIERHWLFELDDFDRRYHPRPLAHPHLQLDDALYDGRVIATGCPEGSWARTIIPESEWNDLALGNGPANLGLDEGVHAIRKGWRAGAELGHFFKDILFDVDSLKRHFLAAVPAGDPLAALVNVNSLNKTAFAISDEVENCARRRLAEKGRATPSEREICEELSVIWLRLRGGSASANSFATVRRQDRRTMARSKGE